MVASYLLSGAKGSFSNTDRTGKTVGGVASDSEGMPQFQVSCRPALCCATPVRRDLWFV